MTSRTHVRPLLHQNGKTFALQRVPYGEKSYDEAWLQALLYDHPELLPCAELDVAFKDMVAVAREMPTDRGPMDVVLLNEQGRVALVECKLWRNPQARREVVAQVMDYARAMSGWDTEHFEKQMAASDPCRAKSFRQLFGREGREFDESAFLDGLSGTLAHGRFLLLIAGDGIRRETQELAEAVASAPQLGFHLALIEIGLYRPPHAKDDTLIIVPEIVTRTREVTRAVVEVRVTGAPAEITASVPVDPKPGTVRSPISEENFFDRLTKAAGSEVVKFARATLSAAEMLGLRVQWMEAGPALKYDDDTTGEFFNFGQLSHDGYVTNMSWLFHRILKLGLPPEIYTDYLDEIIKLLPQATRRHFTTKTGWNRDEIVVQASPKPPIGYIPMSQLVDHVDDWMQIIERTISAIRGATAGRSE